MYDNETAVQHDEHCPDARGLSVDLCSCRLARKWRDEQAAERFIERLAHAMETRGRDHITTLLNRIDALLDAARYEPADELERRLR